MGSATSKQMALCEELATSIKRCLVQGRGDDYDALDDYDAPATAHPEGPLADGSLRLTDESLLDVHDLDHLARHAPGAGIVGVQSLVESKIGPIGADGTATVVTFSDSPTGYKDVGELTQAKWGYWVHQHEEVELYIQLDGGEMDKARISVKYARNDILVIVDDKVVVDIERLYASIVPDECVYTFEEGPSFAGPIVCFHLAKAKDRDWPRLEDALVSMHEASGIPAPPGSAPSLPAGPPGSSSASSTTHSMRQTTLPFEVRAYPRAGSRPRSLS